MKKGFVGNIEQLTLGNTDYRRVLYTAEHSQLVVMSLAPGEEIGEEVHTLDQFIRVERGEAKAILNKTEEHALSDGFAIVVPAGTAHNVVNVGAGDLKLYTIYSPPEHKRDVVEKTKADEYNEHFDGKTSE